MKKFSIKGVLVGAVTDIFATNVTMFPLIIYIAHAQRVMGVPLEKAAVLAPEILRSDTLYFSLSLILGGLCSVLGGYVAAKIAKHDEVLNGALASFLCVASGIYAIIDGNAAPLWQHILFLPCGPLLGALGGYIRLRQLAKK